MAECDWAILCDYAFLDAGRKTCMIGVFDRVFTKSVPSSLHQSALALKLLGNPNEKVNFRIELMRPTGGQLASFGGVITIGDSGGVEMQLGMAGMPLPDFGMYGVNIYADEKPLKTLTFMVVEPPQPQPAG